MEIKLAIFACKIVLCVPEVLADQKALGIITEAMLLAMPINRCTKIKIALSLMEEVFAHCLFRHYLLTKEQHCHLQEAGSW